MGGLIEEAYAAGTQAWPGVQLDLGTFEARILQFDASGQPPPRPADAFVAWAAAEGDPTACRMLERHHMGAAQGTLMRIALDPQVADALLQQLREKLLVGPPPGLLKYSGKGDLSAWIRLVGKRCAIDHFRRMRRQAKHLVALASEPAVVERSRESWLDIERERDAFAQAVAEALAQLSTRDRTLLRLHYASGVSVEALGRAYGVHKATAARWVQRIRNELFDGVRRRMREQQDLSEEEFKRLSTTLHNQIDLALSSWSGTQAGS